MKSPTGRLGGPMLVVAVCVSTSCSLLGPDDDGVEEPSGNRLLPTFQDTTIVTGQLETLVDSFAIVRRVGSAPDPRAVT